MIIMIIHIIHNIHINGSTTVKTQATTKGFWNESEKYHLIKKKQLDSLIYVFRQIYVFIYLLNNLITYLLTYLMI